MIADFHNHKLLKRLDGKKKITIQIYLTKSFDLISYELLFSFLKIIYFAFKILGFFLIFIFSSFSKGQYVQFKNDTGMGEGCILFTSFHMYLDKNFK